MQNRQRLAMIPCSLLLFGPSALLSAAAAQPQVRTLKADYVVMAAAFSPDGRLLATAGHDDGKPKPVSLWDVQSGQLVRTMADGAQRAAALVFSADGNSLAIATLGLEAKDRAIYVWDTQSGELKQRIPLAMPLSSIAFKPDGTTLVGANMVKAFTWDVATGKAQERPVSGSQVDVRPDGETIACVTGGLDGPPVIGIWSVASGQRLKVINTGVDAGHVCRVFLSPDKDTICFWGEDQVVQLWSAGTGKLKRKTNLGAMPPGVFSLHPVALSADGGKFAAISSDGGEQTKVDVWDIKTGARLWSVKGRHNCVAFSPDGTTLAIGDATVDEARVRLVGVTKLATFAP